MDTKSYLITNYQSCKEVNKYDDKNFSKDYLSE